MSHKTELLEKVRAWRDAAVADGWNIKATYAQEPIQNAAKLKRDGFCASVITREEGVLDASFTEGSIYLWGPDDLHVIVPHPYDWEAIQAAVRTCPHCKATDVETQRYSFAGRTCAECLPEMRRRHEQPGWTR